MEEEQEGIRILDINSHGGVRFQVGWWWRRRVLAGSTDGEPNFLPGPSSPRAQKKKIKKEKMDQNPA
jgi:hypothetical protein